MYRKLLGPGLVFTLSGAAAFMGYGIMNGNERLYKSVIMPSVHKLLDPEAAHRAAIIAAKYGFVPLAKSLQDEEMLSVKAFNKTFKNPIGCAAGFDKNGEGLKGLYRMGFGFVEIGTITPLPQPGNDKPRVFRLHEDKAVINRYGFNNDGHEKVAERAQAFRDNTVNKEKILGINIGKNKLQQDAVKDYLDGVNCFGKFADYIVINISSPNTPGLRSLQNKAQLEQLIDPILKVRDQVDKSLPVVVKIAPDLTDSEMIDIAQVLTRKNKKVDGLIVSNTTIDRPLELKSDNSHQTGGLSGRPLKKKANRALKRMYELTKGELTLIGSGGIESGRDALERIKSGASLVQIYTSMSFEGPTIVSRIKRELIHELKKEGFKSISEAIGAEFKPK